MEEVMPMELVKNNFKTTILKLSAFYKRDLVCFYEAETCYGRMTLIVQQFFWEKQREGEEKVQNQETFILIDARNKLLRKQQIVCPLIYQQEIKKIRQNYFICLTLTESLQCKKREDLLSTHSIALYENLVQCASKIDNTEFQYDPSCYLLQHLISSLYTDQLYLDFTMITKRKNKHSRGEINESENFLGFKTELCKIISTPRPGKITEIFFVKQKSVVFNVEALINAKNWVDLALLFNLLQNDRVTILSEKKIKVSPISRLQGCVSIEYKGIRFDDLNFQDGYRVDGLRQVTYPELKANFFQDKITYFMSKRRYQSVRKRYNSEQCWIKNNIEFSDLIIVKEEITKAEFISFLIGYFRYIEPTLHTIKYIAEENALQIEYLNRGNQIKSILMKFTGKYVVKDEEITMIIEKGRLKNTNLDLTKMQITDSCLMFLANCDKMLSIASLDISYCPNISQSGVQLLFASPMCKKLKTLKMSGLTVPDFTVAKFKKELKELKMDNCKPYDEELVISDWKLQSLEALGLNINLHLPQTLKYLVISNEVYLQQIKLLRNLSLAHLKIKLVQNKKNISNFFSNFYMKQNPVRSFAEGNSKNTLKYLDISHSTVKLKEIKPIFMIECLETLICECMEKDKFQDCSLPQNIVSLSLKGSSINSQQLTELMSKTSIIINLNLCKTNVDDSGVQSFIRTKKHINFLEIQQEQFTMNMLEKKNGIQGIHLHLYKLIRDEHEILLNSILLSQAQTNKQMNLICEEKLEAKLIAKVHRFTMFFQAQLSKMLATSLNISINSIPIWKLINYQFKSTHNQCISVLNEHQKPHKVRLMPSSVISEIALQGIQLHMEAFNVFLHKTLSLYPGSLLEVCIRSNRVLNKEVIGLIRKYAGNLLKQIDFRDCIFSYSDVKDDLYLFPVLQCVNQGEYQISLTEQDHCEFELQKILKFFMKLKINEKIKLTIRAQQIVERELFYSILYEILHHYSARILSLSIDFRNMKAEGSEIFWKEVFGLSNLEVFKVAYYNDYLSEDELLTLANEFKNISHFHLYSLDLSTNIPNLLSNHFTFLDIKKLHLDFSGPSQIMHKQAITQPILHKMLKNLTSLIHLQLKIPNSESLCSLRKLSDAIEKMTQLVHLALNIQNSAVKEQQIFQLVYCLHKNRNLERFELNINNINISIAELIKFCQMVQKQNKYCHIVIYALQAKKQMFNRDQNQLLSKGIEIIHSQYE